jgi:DnaK suppressor protein
LALAAGGRPPARPVELTEKEPDKNRSLTAGAQVLNLVGPLRSECNRVSRSTVNKATLKKFRTLLTDKRDEILKKAKQTLEQDMTLDTDDLPDEMDLASSEYLQSFTFRLRGREKSFLEKIEKGLRKLDEGTFGICEECGEEISVKRLEARPETTLCIRCKEDQERMEKDYT